MATQADTIRTEPDPNSPVGEPPAENTSPTNLDEVGIEEALFGDSTADADRIAAALRGDEPAQPSAAPQPAAEAGEVGSAPASPDTPPVGTPPTPAAAIPAIDTPPGSTPALAPPTTPPAAPPANEAALREASLAAQVSTLQAELARLQANPQQPGQQPTGVAPESGQPSAQPAPLERFNLTLPQELTSAIFSDDENTAHAGITRLINDFGTIVYHSAVQAARTHVDQQIGQLVSAAEQGQAEQTRISAREQGQAQYYEAFPTHNNPLMEPILRAQAQAMATEFPGLQWGPDYINALGARVNGYVANLTGQPAAAEPTPAPVGQVPPARPAAMIPVGTPRPSGAPGSEPEGSDLILNTLQLF